MPDLRADNRRGSPRLPVERCSNCKEHLDQKATTMPIPEYILNSQCPHRVLYQNCKEAACNEFLRDVEESTDGPDEDI